MNENLKGKIVGGLIGFIVVAGSLGIGVYAAKTQGDTLTAEEWNRIYYRATGLDAGKTSGSKVTFQDWNDIAVKISTNYKKSLNDIVTADDFNNLVIGISGQDDITKYRWKNAAPVPFSYSHSKPSDITYRPGSHVSRPVGCRGGRRRLRHSSPFRCGCFSQRDRRAGTHWRRVCGTCTCPYSLVK